MEGYFTRATINIVNGQCRSRIFPEPFCGTYWLHNAVNTNRWAFAEGRGVSIVGVHSILHCLLSYSVIFVHGIMGHPQATWQTASSPSLSESIRLISGRTVPTVSQSHESVFWPLDSLPKDVSNVQIWTYGYDARIRRIPAQKDSFNIRRHGEDLKNKLENLLQTSRLIQVWL